MKTTHKRLVAQTGRKPQRNCSLSAGVGNWSAQNLILFAGTTALLAAMVYSAMAQVPQPVLSISSLGSNQFSIMISNSISTNYTLEWIPYLGNTNYSWQSQWEVQGSNTTVDTGSAQEGWFRVMVGIDGDGDGIPPWLDANDNDTNVGILSVTIDSPLDGSTLQ